MDSSALVPRCSSCAVWPHGSVLFTAASHRTLRIVARSCEACTTLARTRVSCGLFCPDGSGANVDCCLKKAEKPALLGSSSARASARFTRCFATALALASSRGADACTRPRNPGGCLQCSSSCRAEAAAQRQLQIAFACSAGQLGAASRPRCPSVACSAAQRRADWRPWRLKLRGLTAAAWEAERPSRTAAAWAWRRAWRWTWRAARRSALAAAWAWWRPRTAATRSASAARLAIGSVAPAAAVGAVDQGRHEAAAWWRQPLQQRMSRLSAPRPSHQRRPTP